MVIIADAVTPYAQGPLDLIGAELDRVLNEPFTLIDVDTIVGDPITNRFPTPPAAGGFLIDLNHAGQEIIADIVGLNSPYYLMGAMVPEGDFLEPTLGQIWPRIG